MLKMLRARVIGSKMIKSLLKYLLNLFNHIVIYGREGVSVSSSRLLFFHISLAKSNQLKIKRSCIQRTRISIQGEGNLIQAEHADFHSCQITINGRNNTLSVGRKARLRKAIIIIRGSNNHITIGENTSFGTVRMINVGRDNALEIGKDCLFSDYVEIWASDTHSIYDSEGKFINPEKPIIIGDKVWVGSHVFILKGADIGQGAIIGINSLVTKNIEERTLNAGNPLRVLKRDVTWTNEYEHL